MLNDAFFLHKESEGSSNILTLMHHPMDSLSVTLFFVETLLTAAHSVSFFRYRVGHSVKSSSLRANIGSSRMEFGRLD